MDALVHWGLRSGNSGLLVNSPLKVCKLYFADLSNLRSKALPLLTAVSIAT